MYRKFIATIAAASIALTAIGSAPAFADQDRTTQAIAALLGLAVVGTIISENRKDKKRREHSYHRAPDRNPVKRNGRAYHNPKPRPLPDRVNRKLLPGECFRSFDTRRGKVRMFGQRCLERKYRHADRLPRQCQSIIRTRSGRMQGYDARCLRDRGYSLARG